MYIIVAFVVSLIGQPVMRLLRKVRIRGKSAPDGILAILTILENTDAHGYYAYLKVILVMAALCIGINYMSVFSDGQAISVRNYHPELFYRIQYLFTPG